jgi:hypothetical protein
MAQISTLPITVPTPGVNFWIRQREITAMRARGREHGEQDDDALRWAANATTERERRSLMRLARTWVEAAAMSQNPMLVGNYISTDHNTAR